MSMVLHPINAGKLMNNIECLTPCTPQGSMIMINSIAEDTSGMNAVVLGRSTQLVNQCLNY